MQEEKNIYDQLTVMDPKQVSYTIIFDSDEENEVPDAVVDTNHSLPNNNSSLDNNHKNSAAVTQVENIDPLNNTSNNSFSKAGSENDIQTKEQPGKRKYNCKTGKENCTKRPREERDKPGNRKYRSDNNEEKAYLSSGEKQSSDLDQAADQSEKVSTRIKSVKEINADHNDRNTDPTILQCYKNLLKAVSENLIEIIHTFDNNAKDVINNHMVSGSTESRKSWEKCIRKKHNLFNLSYCTVLNVLLPQQHNNNFLDNFVKDTCNLMKSKGMICTESQMRNLTKEVIDWTSRKSSNKQKNDNNKGVASTPGSDAISYNSITISDDEDEFVDKNLSQQDNNNAQEFSQSLSDHQKKSSTLEEDPLKVDIEDKSSPKTRQPLTSEQGCLQRSSDPLELNQQDKRSPKIRDTVTLEQVYQQYSLIYDKDPLELDELNKISSRETITVDEVYNHLFTNNPNSKIEKILIKNNQDLQDTVSLNQDNRVQDKILKQSSFATSPTNSVPFEIHQKTSLYQTEIQQEPLQQLHRIDGLIPSASRTLLQTMLQTDYSAASKPKSQASKKPIQRKMNVTSEPSNIHCQSGSHHDPSAPVPPIIYNHTIVNHQNSTVVQQNYLDQNRFIPPPANPHYYNALPNCNNSSQTFNQIQHSTNFTNRQFLTQNDALPQMQRYHPTQFDQIENEIQVNYITKHKAQKSSQENNLQKNTNSKTTSRQLLDFRHHNKPNQLYTSDQPWGQNINTHLVARKDGNSLDQNQHANPNILNNYNNETIERSRYLHNQLNTYQPQQQLITGRTWHPQTVSTTQNFQNDVAQLHSNYIPAPPPSYRESHNHVRIPNVVIPAALPQYPNGSRYFNNDKTPSNMLVRDTLEQNHQRSNQSNEQIENIRSVSADSGIMSPLNFNSTTPGPVNDTADSTSPMITHVTSLNPNATYHPSDECFVCKTITRKKCLGCLMIYYCSVQCQKVDWDAHREACKLKKKDSKAT